MPRSLRGPRGADRSRVGHHGLRLGWGRSGHGGRGRIDLRLLGPCLRPLPTGPPRGPCQPSVGGQARRMCGAHVPALGPPFKACRNTRGTTTAGFGLCGRGHLCQRLLCVSGWHPCHVARVIPVLRLRLLAEVELWSRKRAGPIRSGIDRAFQRHCCVQAREGRDLRVAKHVPAARARRGRLTHCERRTGIPCGLGQHTGRG
mmetsp:Transcript_2285/g.6944  ORF Transcript_2285/g.6944 Transcript_2285/m.6944 type:complete len:202 (-) Transcript_2285:1829-2434(-)